QPVEFTSVMYRTVGQAGQPGQEERAGVRVRRASEGDADVYARTAAEGWREFGYHEFMLDTARMAAATEGLVLFLAEFDGRPIATACLAASVSAQPPRTFDLLTASVAEQASHRRVAPKSTPHLPGEVFTY